MVTHFDEKGKFFTEVISKNAIPATIQTVTHRIRGNVYVRKGDRLRDEFNRAEQFAAVTDATIYDAKGDVLFESAFLAVNRDHIVWLLPEKDEFEDLPEQPGGEL